MSNTLFEMVDATRSSLSVRSYRVVHTPDIGVDQEDKAAASARSLLNAMHKAYPFKSVKLLIDNGTEFTDRLFGARERQPSGNHNFATSCCEYGN